MVASWAPLAMKRHLLSLSPTSISLSMAPSPTTYHSPPIQHLLSLQVLRRRPPSGFNAAVRLVPPHVSMARKAEGSFDPELRKVLELASNTELYELERILFGPSYLSPLIKSISSGAEFDHVMIEEDLQERGNFIEALESRFLYLAADARSTLRGWRPSYRNVLLGVRKELNVPCSSKLPTNDLEIEIFIYMFCHYSVQLKGDAAALRVGTAELQSMLLKGGGVLTLLKMSNLMLRRFSSKLLLDAAKCQIENGFIRKGLAGVASRYLGLRSLMSFLGPLLLGTFLADIAIVMLGTDYARVLQAIYTFAQDDCVFVNQWRQEYQTQGVGQTPIL